MTGDRDNVIDHILNVIDGVESKSTEIMIVLTTNDIENITPALLRPGRLDAVIYIDKPDAKAAERLARQYGRGLISDDEDISEAAAALAGRIPAVIREAVERSKLAAIMMTPIGEPLRISNAALLHSATRMQIQLNLLEPKFSDTRSETVKSAEIVAAAHERAVQAGLAQGFVVPLPTAPVHPAETLFDHAPKSDKS
jgi:transitional endoplasmic reticulum ATPase